MWRPFPPRTDQPAVHYTCFQVGSNQLQNTRVGNVARQQAHQHVDVAQVEDIEAVVEAESGEHSSVRGASVIYVDDEPSIVRVAEKVLAREGYVVRTFTHPLDAIRAVKRGAPDVLVTDLSMPQLTGIDLIRQVRELYPNLPVVLTTGHLSAELELELRGMGVAHVVLKADMVTQLGDALVAALGAKPD